MQHVFSYFAMQISCQRTLPLTDRADAEREVRGWIGDQWKGLTQGPTQGWLSANCKILYAPMTTLD